MTTRLRKSLGILIAALGVLLAVYALASWYIVGQGLVAEAVPIEHTPAAAYEEVSFSPRGWEEITLRGWWLQAPEPALTIIWLHGLDSNKGSRIDVVNGLRSAGFNVLAFDFRGHGESDKAPMGASIHEQDDLLGAIDWLERERSVSIDQVGLLGLSYGSAVALLTAAREPRLRAVMVDSGYASLTELMTGEVADRTSAPEPVVTALKPGILLTARFSRGLNLNDAEPIAAAAALDFPIALVHCRADERVPPEHSRRIRAAAPQASTLTIVDDCEHGRASEAEGAAYVHRATTYFHARLRR
ncbi:MAG: alpha/beta fold hydrolase [Dehalococcoidia bacterium]|nr:alpha/beta fold hydrolase [Dehalococcoidia bacterium]